ncbi:MAG: hypothetical protein K5777_07170 [Nitrosopumilus sp.]|nr:hypothetical protein [Nitrosopumilus sp.]
MRTTQKNKTEKYAKIYKISVPNRYSQSLANVVLTLTTFERKGGET